ncbi:unnamed protein product, partial [Mesorhabditis spiculigera]
MTRIQRTETLLYDRKIECFEKLPGDVDLAKMFALAQENQGNDDPFMVLNIDTLIEKVDEWKRELPRVEPCYAVKCNPDKVLVEVLANLGVGFDCASQQEIEDVLIHGCKPENIIYAHPCKPIKHLKAANNEHVEMMTFDTEEELLKVRAHHENPKMILRIAVADPTALCQLNTKFGVDPVDQAPQLLTRAKELKVDVAGISFHIGSGANDFTTYELAIEHARRLFDFALKIGHPMNVLDIGGGFPGGEHKMSFDKIAAVVRGALDKHFPDDSTRIIAEPGRFFAAAPICECVNVIHAALAPRKLDAPNHMAYYINDGIFGSFNCKLYDHIHPQGIPLRKPENDLLHPTTIWGPTCDGADKVEENVLLPKLEIGSWLFYPEMGAYTITAGSTFNGFPRPKMYYAISRSNYEKYLA